MNINWKVTAAQSPIIFYRSTEWEGLKLVHWRVNAGELVETVFDQHEISLPMAGNFTTIKQTATGNCKVTHRAPGNLSRVLSNARRA